MQYCLPPKELKVTFSVETKMATVLWDCEIVLISNKLKKGLLKAAIVECGFIEIEHLLYSSHLVPRDYFCVQIAKKRLQEQNLGTTMNL